MFRPGAPCFLGMNDESKKSLAAESIPLDLLHMRGGVFNGPRAAYAMHVHDPYVCLHLFIVEEAFETNSKRVFQIKDSIELLASIQKGKTKTGLS